MEDILTSMVVMITESAYNPYNEVLGTPVTELPTVSLGSGRLVVLGTRGHSQEKVKTSKSGRRLRGRCTAGSRRRRPRYHSATPARSLSWRVSVSCLITLPWMRARCEGAGRICAPIRGWAGSVPKRVMRKPSEVVKSPKPRPNVAEARVTGPGQRFIFSCVFGHSDSAVFTPIVIYRCVLDYQRFL
jgi:hypothetical protein